MRLRHLSALVCLAILLPVLQVNSVELEPSNFELEQQKIRYDNSIGSALNDFSFDQFEDDFSEGGVAGASRSSYKSPTKAFLMSFAVPGLGQYYNGSKLKAVAFLGLEVAGWVYRDGLRSDGDKLEAEFIAFNDEHWYRDRYEEYLDTLFGTPNDADIDTSVHISHHLPDTKTQQYYEMTGKYDQFAWGWDDARINDQDLPDLIATQQLQVINTADPNTIPYSPNRVAYEQMRYDSNQKFKSARRIASLILVNHLVAGLEAFFSAKKNNKNASTGGDNQWSVRAGLKSYYAVQDTPYLKVSYKF